MRLPNGTVLLVCDGSKALLLRNHGDTERMDLRVLEALQIDNPPDREQSSDRPGRFTTPTGAKTAVQETDRHEAAEDQFAVQAADLAICALHASPEARLVVAADPRTLGRLRTLLQDRGIGEAVILAEIDKDLAHCPVAEIERLVSAY